MKVRFIGKDDPIGLRNNKVYDVMSVERTWYRIIDETKEDYLFPPHLFEIVEN